MKINRISLIAAVGIFTLSSLAYSQEQAKNEERTPVQLLKFLNEKERRYLNDKGSVEDLSDEEVEHVQRIQRLRQLHMEEDAEETLIVEAAGAGRPDVPQPIVEPQPASVTGTIGQEDATELARENAVLRAEVRRLRAQLRAIDQQSQDLLYPEFDRYQPQRRFYVPVH